jgi:hypothetical protein
VKRVTPLPEGDEADTARGFVDSLTEVERALTRYQAALARNDAPAAQQALAESGAAGAQARSEASTLGVTECGGYSGS